MSLCVSSVWPAAAKQLWPSRWPAACYQKRPIGALLGPPLDLAASARLSNFNSNSNFSPASAGQELRARPTRPEGDLIERPLWATVNEGRPNECLICPALERRHIGRAGRLGSRARLDLGPLFCLKSKSRALENAARPLGQPGSQAALDADD